MKGILLACGLLSAIGTTAFIDRPTFVPVNPRIIERRTLEAHHAVPQNVQAILERACSDCHSNHTRWPWYSALPVVSTILQSDVQRARKQMNFSDWSATVAQGTDEEQGKLKGICENIRAGDMPLPAYSRMNSQARLSAADVEAVCNWAASAALATSATQAAIK